MVRLLLLAILVGVLIEYFLRFKRDLTRKNRRRNLYDSPQRAVVKALGELAQFLGYQTSIKPSEAKIWGDYLSKHLGESFFDPQKKELERAQVLGKQFKLLQNSERVILLFGLIVSFYSFFAAKPIAILVVTGVFVLWLAIRFRKIMAQTLLHQLFDEWLVHIQPGLKSNSLKDLRIELRQNLAAK